MFVDLSEQTKWKNTIQNIQKKKLFLKKEYYIDLALGFVCMDNHANKR